MTDDVQQPDDRIPTSIPSKQEPNSIELRCLIDELTRQQNDARARAVYGGMTVAEAKEYDERRDRIWKLTEQLLSRKKTEGSSTQTLGVGEVFLLLACSSRGFVFVPDDLASLAASGRSPLQAGLAFRDLVPARPVRTVPANVLSFRRAWMTSRLPPVSDVVIERGRLEVVYDGGLATFCSTPNTTGL